MSLEDHIKSLELREKNGASLYCEDTTPLGREEFNTCESFDRLRDRGCYGYTTYEINKEISYSGLCKKLRAIRQANPSNINFIDTESNNWWAKLPAKIIPISGGIHNTEILEMDHDKRKELVSSKLLGELIFKSVITTVRKVEIVIETWEEDCGEVEDYLEFSAVLLADFDGDGIAELMLEGSRFKRSGTCHLGTANMLGAEFSVLIKMTGASSLPTASHFLK